MKFGSVLSLLTTLVMLDESCMAQEVPIMESAKNLMCVKRKYGLESMENRRL